MRRTEKTLSIDPEDLEAYYNVMLCFNAKGDQDSPNDAHWQQWHGRKREFISLRREGGPQAFDWWTADLGDYLRMHPDDNNERQPIHEHLSIPLNHANVPKR